MKRACVIGWPIEHSRSPLIHSYWLKKYGIDGAYTKEAVPPEAVTQFLRSLAQNEFVGCNVTVPHKEAAFAAADVRDASALAVSAANTLWVEGGKLHAANTDTYGFMTYLKERAPGWDANDLSVSILGAGAELQESLPPRVENQGVDCPVQQVIRMHLGPGSSARDPVLFVDYCKLLLRGIFWPLRQNRLNFVHQSDPLRER